MVIFIVKISKVIEIGIFNYTVSKKFYSLISMLATHFFKAIGHWISSTFKIEECSARSYNFLLVAALLPLESQNATSIDKMTWSVSVATASF